MSTDERCCGSGTCIIDANGLCWCGQVWQGDTLCGPAVEVADKASELADTTGSTPGIDAAKKPLATP